MDLEPVRFIFRSYLGGYSAARPEPGGNLHPARPAGTAQVVQDIVCQCLVKNALIAVALHIELQALQLDAQFVGTILDNNLAEVGLARPGADARKFRASDCYTVVSLGMGIVEQLQFWLFTHFVEPRKNPAKLI